MPRARLLKPEAYNSQQISEAGELAFSFMQTLWVWGDDCGVHPAQPHAIARCGIGTWGHGAAEVQRRIERLKTALDSSRDGEPLLYEYEVAGVRFWLLPGFIRQNANQHKPSCRFPLPRIGADSPKWLIRWIREFAELLRNLPTTVRGRYPDVHESYPDLDLDLEADFDLDLDSYTRPFSNSAAREAQTAAPAGSKPAGAKGPGGRKRTTATALERVLGKLEASSQLVQELLDDDPAIAAVVQFEFGGWPKLVDAFRSDRGGAVTKFRKAFGRTCSARGSPRRARAA